MSQALLLALLSLVLFWFHRRRAGLSALLVSIAWLYLCSTAAFADLLIGVLEDKYSSRAMSAVDTADAIVLLGGAARGHTHRGRLADLNEHADRLVHAVALYKAGKAPTIVVTGGAAAGDRPEASQIRDHLEVMGVPSRAIVLELQSRNTYDNARYTVPMLEARNIKSVLLVTSAYHMPRARGVFLKQGLEIIPAPTDHKRLVATRAVPPWLPGVGNLVRTSLALHEMFGFMVYRWRGWL